MYRVALRSSTARVAQTALRQPVLSYGARRALSTAPEKKGTWKGAAVRWGVAIGALYWYTTSPVFADEAARPLIHPAPEVTEPEPELPTVDAVVEDRRKAAVAVKEKEAKEKAAKSAVEGVESGALGDASSPEALEEEAGQQGAFNPDTGEINWDCPCLGGMAHGPCGEEFRSAFSCFVFSEVEPKGMDCIDKFQHMQDCFRQYPEVYGSELSEDDGEGAAPVEDTGAASLATSDSTPTAAPSESKTADASATVDTAKKVKEDVKEEIKEDVKVAKKATKKTKKAIKETATTAAEKVEAVVEEAPKQLTEAVKEVKESAAAAVPPESDGFDELQLPKAAFDATGANRS